jgi:hypothetical protein
LDIVRKLKKIESGSGKQDEGKSQAGDLEEVVRRYENLCASPGMPKGTTPVFVACDECREDVLAHLIENGAEVNVQNEDGFCPLHVIAKGWGALECAELLVKNGADVNLKTRGDGMVPLHWAAATGKQELVELFLRSGARQDIPNSEGRLPIDLAKLNYEREPSEGLRRIMEVFGRFND